MIVSSGSPEHTSFRRVTLTLSAIGVTWPIMKLAIL